MEEIFTINEGVLKFNGHCEQCRPYCSSHCCKILKANLTPDEVASGKYLMEYKKQLDGSFFYEYYLRRHRVNWSRYNVCVYLNSEYKCDIYDDRPEVCKNFNCSNKVVEIGTFKKELSKETIINKSGVEDIAKVNNAAIMWASIGSLKTMINELDKSLDKDSKVSPYDVIDDMADIINNIENEIVLSMNSGD